MENNIEQKIEAILFYKNQNLKIKDLAKFLKTQEPEIKKGLSKLKESLKERGITLVEKEYEVMLATAPEFSELIEEIEKEEINKKLSKASLETLSIILYKSGASRAQIDFTRGVNSNFTLRKLSTRGLIEKVPDKEDSRKYIYKPTLNLLAFLGVKSVKELPSYEETKQQLENMELTLKTLQDEKNKTEQENIFKQTS